MIRAQGQKPLGIVSEHMRKTKVGKPMCADALPDALNSKKIGHLKGRRGLGQAPRGGPPTAAWLHVGESGARPAVEQANRQRKKKGKPERNSGLFPWCLGTEDRGKSTGVRVLLGHRRKKKNQEKV